MPVKLAAWSHLSFQQIIEILRDGKSYKFSAEGMKGYFFKAPFPDQQHHTARDGALSAITYWEDGKPASPTLMLYDFDPNEADWSIEEADSPN